MSPLKTAKNLEMAKPYTDADWQAVADSPMLTEKDFAKAKPFVDVFPELADRMRRSRGPQKDPTKIAVSLRLDREVVEHFRASGKGWQSRINDILRQNSGTK